MTYTVPLLVVGTIFLAVSTWLGVRLLLLARATRRAPELLMGLAFLVGGCVGYVLEVLSQDGASIPSEWRPAAYLLGRLCVNAGVVMATAFTWKVFRRDDTWARGIVLALALLLAASLGASWLAGPSPWTRSLEIAGRFAAPSWSAYEALRYHGAMSRRLRLGLADPVVTNRFLLWGIAQVFSLLGLLARLLDSQDVLPSLAGVAMPTAGLVTVVAYWLTFFPPAAYLRRLGGGYEGLVHG